MTSLKRIGVVSCQRKMNFEMRQICEVAKGSIRGYSKRILLSLF